MAIYKSKNYRIRLVHPNDLGCQFLECDDANHTWFLCSIDGKSIDILVTNEQYEHFLEVSYQFTSCFYLCERRGHREWVIDQVLPAHANISKIVKNKTYEEVLKMFGKELTA
jgi:hypothetical protein